eukprot:SAG31_NODE_2996_length_4803_cov_8.948342_1_plen_20_part_10
MYAAAAETGTKFSNWQPLVN